MTANKASHVLRRDLGLTDAIAVGLGAIMGAGIFVVTGEAAGIAGPGFLAGLLIAGLIAGFNALSSAQLAAVYPQAGGTYEYGYRLLNPSLGFAAGWMFLVSKLFGAAVVASGFGYYMSSLINSTNTRIYSLAAIIILTLANLYGIKKAGKLNLVIVGITLFSLLVFSFTGLHHVQPANLKPFAPFGFQGIAESAAVMFFAFTGYARIATLAEEVKDPSRTIPRAVIITISVAILLYMLVAYVAAGLVGTEPLARALSPLHFAAKQSGSTIAALLIRIGACTAMLGVLLSQIMGISRMMLAMARRNDFPLLFGEITFTSKIPANSILLTGLLIIVILFAGSFTFILKAAAFSILLYYAIANLAAGKQPSPEQLYGKWIPAAGFFGCVLMSASLPLQVILSGVVMLLAGFLFRFIYKRMLIK